jgi:hypothetical protein
MGYLHVGDLESVWVSQHNALRKREDARSGEKEGM